jgi:hypothetical protein
VAVIGSNDVWAVGGIRINGIDGTLVQHWNGENWSIAPSPHPGSAWNNVYSVAAVPSNDVWAVGDYNNSAKVDQALIMRYSVAPCFQIYFPFVVRGYRTSQ